MGLESSNIQLQLGRLKSPFVVTGNVAGRGYFLGTIWTDQVSNLISNGPDF